MKLSMPTKTLALSVALATGAVSQSASAATIINESSYGDFSNIWYDTSLAPTSLGVLANDTYVLNGQVGWNADEVDTYTFEIAAGQTLQSVVFTLFDPAVSGDYVSVYMNRGAHISFEPQDEVEMINLNHLNIGTDLLQFDSAQGVQDAGSYTMRWTSIYGPGNYQVEFQVSAVPVPAAIWLMGSGLIALSACARRRRS